MFCHGFKLKLSYVTKLDIIRQCFFMMTPLHYSPDKTLQESSGCGTMFLRPVLPQNDMFTLDLVLMRWPNASLYRAPAKGTV